MAWTLRWRLSVSSQSDRLELTVGSPETEIHRVRLSTRDVWALRQGSTVLRDGVLVVPEGGCLRFLLTRPALDPEDRLLQILDASVLGR